MTILIKQATLLSPNSKHHRKKRDLLIKNGIIEKIATSINAKASKTINVKGLYVSDGWKDIFADFCDPGFEHKEDIQSGIQLAKAGGYTGVCLIPNTNPTINSKSQVDYVKNQCKKSGINLLPIGAVSNNIEGEQLAEMYDMNKAGALLFSDGKKSIQSAGLLLKALQYLKTIGGTLIQIPDTKSISNHGLMNEGNESTALGMPGIPAIAEHLQIQRDITLCEYAESKIHFTGVSTKKSVELIVSAKKRGVNVSCSVAPYHLLYTDGDLQTYDANLKIFPPLRTSNERKYLIKALKEGKIDGIASHHTPQDVDAKKVEFAYANEGMISLQYILPILIKAGFSAEEIAQATTGAFKSVSGLDSSIEVNKKADLTMFTIAGSTDISKENNLSKSENTPLLNETMIGSETNII
jgi:dihydroorotase